MAGEVAGLESGRPSRRPAWKTAILGLVVCIFAATAAWYGLLAFGIVRLLFPRTGPQSIDVEVEPELTPSTVVWREGHTDSVDWGTGPIAVEVQASRTPESEIHIIHRFRFPTGHRDVELWLMLEPDGPPAARAGMVGVDNLHGTLRLSSDRLPADPEQALIVHYDIDGWAHGSDTPMSAAIGVCASDLR